MKKTICLILALILLAASFSACGGDGAAEPLLAERGKVEREPIGDLKPAQNAEAILEALQNAGRTFAGPDSQDAPRAEGLRLAAAGAAQGDTVAALGDYIYMLDSYGLVILSMAGERSEILSYTRVEKAGNGFAQRLYLAEDRAAVVYTVSGYDPELGTGWEDSDEVHVAFLDTADKRAPRLLTETVVAGSLVDARLVENRLCLVTRQGLLALPEEAEALLPSLTENGKTLRLDPLDVYLSPEPDRAALSMISALRMEDGRVTDAIAFTGTVEGVGGRDRDFFLCRTFWTEELSEPRREEPYTVVDCTVSARTELKHLRLDNGLQLLGGCVLEGALPDVSALGVLEGGLCAVTGADSRSFSAYTDEKHGWTNYEEGGSLRSSQLAVLNEELELSGALTSLGGEAGLADCRFAGGAAWLSAAGESGAVHTVDLRDPAAPSPAGDLAVEGETLYLREFGAGLVLCLEAPAGEGDWRLTMFDLRDPAAPKALDTLRLENPPAGALTDPGALFTDPAAGLAGLPVRKGERNQYLLLHWTGEAWKERGSLALEYLPDNARAILKDGLLYICTPGEVCVVDPERAQPVATVSNAVG
ncbi:MAG: beta-propeller domain-containing protein [Oscillospiraceae bacterium]|nr:beta-propeller domain-containing protein [Oscillospiraceae bacterium]